MRTYSSAQQYYQAIKLDRFSCCMHLQMRHIRAYAVRQAIVKPGTYGIIVVFIDRHIDRAKFSEAMSGMSSPKSRRLGTARGVTFGATSERAIQARQNIPPYSARSQKNVPPPMPKKSSGETPPRTPATWGLLTRSEIRYVLQARVLRMCLGMIHVSCMPRKVFTFGFLVFVPYTHTHIHT
jgi:hypothetical protein